MSVSSTPGKTKHFQTIHLSDKVLLCDCPRLVFPNFASTKAELVCNGVLPIDQLREYTGPAALVARRIPKLFLEGVYGFKIRTRPLEEGGTGIPTGEELLSAYALYRGYLTQGFGQPDQPRAARYVLKDYVAGKLLYCEPPPIGIDPQEFNSELYDVAHLPEKRQAAFTAATDAAAQAAEALDDVSIDDLDIPLPQGAKSKKLDKSFFKPSMVGAGHIAHPFNRRYTEQGKQELASGKQLSSRKMRAMIALEQGIDPKEVQLTSGKKHFKGTKKPKGKLRAQNKGNDDD